MPEPNQGAVDFIWIEAEKRLEAQLRQADALDTKAGVLVGIHALSAGLIASIAGDLSAPARSIAIVVIAGLLLSGALAFLAFRSQEYHRSPGPEELWVFSNWDDWQVRGRFLTTRFRAIEGNQRRLRRKARCVAASLSLFGVVALMVSGATVVSLLR